MPAEHLRPAPQPRTAIDRIRELMRPDVAWQPVDGHLGTLARKPLPASRARMFSPDDIPGMLDGLGYDRIHSHVQANMVIVRARKAPGPGGLSGVPQHATHW